MTSLRFLGAAALALALAVPAGADITVTQKTTGKGMGGNMSGEAVQYIKGTKMRADQTTGNEKTSTIMDAATRQLIILNHTRREAEIHDAAEIGEALSKVTTGDVQASVTPTGETRQVAGVSCTVHDMQIAVPVQMPGGAGGPPMTFVLAGPVCLAANSPGADDYRTFFEAAAKSGLFFGNPRVAQAQPGQARGMAALYREMASRGVPYASEIKVSIEGSGPMAAMMAKMGGMTTTTEVVSVSTDTIPESTFEIPEGYTKKG